MRIAKSISTRAAQFSQITPRRDVTALLRGPRGRTDVRPRVGHRWQAGHQTVIRPAISPDASATPQHRQGRPARP